MDTEKRQLSFLGNYLIPLYNEYNIIAHLSISWSPETDCDASKVGSLHVRTA